MDYVEKLCNNYKILESKERKRGKNQTEVNEIFILKDFFVPRSSERMCILASAYFWSTILGQCAEGISKFEMKCSLEFQDSSDIGHICRKF